MKLLAKVIDLARYRKPQPSLADRMLAGYFGQVNDFKYRKPILLAA